MKKKMNATQRILVKLDHKTTVMLNKISSFKVWKARYPLAKIIN